MSDQLFEIVFRGDIAPGANFAEVRQRLGELFKADEQQLERLFSGRPSVIRRSLDSATAERYQNAIQQTGALVQIRASKPEMPAQKPVEAASSAEPVPSEQAAETDPGPGWGLAPVGADVLNDNEKRPQVDANVDTSALNLAPEGSDVLKPEERKPYEEREVDTSGLTLE
ncbi:hypothetical protein QP938_01970 [Porticoccaceae bacterium LTM1]|nr:hypothetical protein QP938_01970 [Porticoccaceae bacterium LTM1]